MTGLEWITECLENENIKFRECVLHIGFLSTEIGKRADIIQPWLPRIAKRYDHTPFMATRGPHWPCMTGFKRYFSVVYPDQTKTEKFSVVFLKEGNRKVCVDTVLANKKLFPTDKWKIRGPHH